MNSNNYFVGSHFNETPKEAIIPPPSPLQQQQTVEFNQSSMNIDQEPPMNQIFLDPNEMDTQEFKKLVEIFFFFFVLSFFFLKMKLFLIGS